MATANYKLHSIFMKADDNFFFVVGTCLEQYLPIDTVLYTVGFTIFFEETLKVQAWTKRHFQFEQEKGLLHKIAHFCSS